MNNRILAAAAAVAEHVCVALDKSAAVVYTDILNGNPDPAVRLFFWQHLQREIAFLRRNFPAGAATVPAEWDAFLFIVFGGFAVSGSALEQRPLRTVMVAKYLEKVRLRAHFIAHNALTLIPHPPFMIVVGRTQSACDATWSSRVLAQVG